MQRQAARDRARYQVRKILGECPRIEQPVAQENLELGELFVRQGDAPRERWIKSFQDRSARSSILGEIGRDAFRYRIIEPGRPKRVEMMMQGISQANE